MGAFKNLSFDLDTTWKDNIDICKSCDVQNLNEWELCEDCDYQVFRYRDKVQDKTIKGKDNNMDKNLNTYIEISKLSVRMETKDKLIVSLVDGTAIWLNKNNCFNNEFMLTFRASFFTNDKAGQPTLINKWKLNTLTGAYDDTGLKVSLQDLNTLTGVK